MYEVINSFNDSLIGQQYQHQFELNKHNPTQCILS